jgi:hypothetical protein
MQKPEEVNIIVDMEKIVSLLTALQMRKLTLIQSSELERLLTKERSMAIQNRVTDLDIIRILFDRIGWPSRKMLLSKRIGNLHYTLT